MGRGSSPFVCIFVCAFAQWGCQPGVRFLPVCVCVCVCVCAYNRTVKIKFSVCCFIMYVCMKERKKKNKKKKRKERKEEGKR